ncbi:MAG: BrnA antitoxin family protein [Stigonema ocellatum SAG 48.90 = DSM 106950]|nr:BrnA antitoxin family protein [Stigonema ocellatum SAG 48.90 = DSM 106950]
MKKGHSNPVPPEIQAEIDALAALPEDQIKTDDIPEVWDWNSAKRGLFYRPIKQQITLRLDADLIDWFKNHHQQDEGYQTSINRALREYVARQEG